jgi:hypothetical protein
MSLHHFWRVVQNHTGYTVDSFDCLTRVTPDGIPYVQTLVHKGRYTGTALVERVDHNNTGEPMCDSFDFQLF